MSMITLRRTGALLGSAALLASMTVATVAAPAAAGKCEEFTGSFPADPADCYYATEPFFVFAVPTGVTLNGSDGDDQVGVLDGTFNGGRGEDRVRTVFGTFNGGPGNDTADNVWFGLFNGGSGDDTARAVLDGVFNGGSGDDVVNSLDSYNPTEGTYAGGGGKDTLNDYKAGTCYSVELGDGSPNC